MINELLMLAFLSFAAPTPVVGCNMAMTAAQETIKAMPGVEIRETLYKADLDRFVKAITGQDNMGEITAIVVLENPPVPGFPLLIIFQDKGCDVGAREMSQEDYKKFRK